MRIKSKSIIALLLALCMLASVFTATQAAEVGDTSETTLLLGDSNLDGRISIRDATVIQRHLVQLQTITGDALLTSRVTGKEQITISDATAIQKFLAQIPVPYYINKPVGYSESDDWRKSSIGYEIFVRSFYDTDGDGIGDFRGVAEKVDYLNSLNVGVVWLMPIYPTGTYHGYDVQDYTDVNPDLGTMEDFEYMLGVLHENGIKVILDFVANHTSNQNDWFLQSAADPDSPYRDFYVWSNRSGSGYHYNNTAGMYYYGGFDSIMPDLNYNNPEVWTAVEESAGFWLDKGVDGFRLDAAKHIDDSNKTLTHNWWRDFESYVKEKNPNAFVVGENWTDRNEIATFYEDMDSSFDFPLQGNLIRMANGSYVDLVGEVNSAWDLYSTYIDKAVVPITPINTTMIGNHDMTRAASQIATATGCKLAAALQMTLPGMPFIYYGEEIGMQSGGSDPNRRESLDWYTAINGEGMTNSTAWGVNRQYTKANDGISVQEQSADPNSLLSYYRKLTQIRTENPAFYTGSYSGQVMMGDTYSYFVTGENGAVYYVIHNISENEKTIPVVATFSDLMTGNSYSSGDTLSLGGGATVIANLDTAENPLDLSGLSSTIGPKTYNITFEVTLPENTPADASISLAGNFAGNNWTPGDSDFILTRTSATTAQITIPFSTESRTIEYKFTLGSWDKREVTADGEDTENRVYTLSDLTATVVETVVRWSEV